MPKKVPYPLFEPVGPPCPIEGCKGVLWQHMNFKTGQSWKQCTACGKHVDEMPIKERLQGAIETIQNALEGSLDDDPSPDWGRSPKTLH